MKERDKMLLGEIYNPADAELYSDRMHAKNACIRYNALEATDIGTRTTILKKLLGKTGEHPHIEPNFFCDYGYNIEVGNNFYANHNLVILDCAKVKMGNNVFLFLFHAPLFHPYISVHNHRTLQRGCALYGILKS